MTTKSEKILIENGTIVSTFARGISVPGKPAKNLDNIHIIFFGSRECSVRFLDALIEKEKVIGVITHPDRPSGRGLQVRQSIVKEFSIKNEIPVFTPENLKDKKFISEIESLKPDLGVVVAYGKILPKEIFLIPRYKTINVHFSLLPKYRGAAPIQWAIIRGEKITGVTIFFIDEGLDTGKILLQKEVEIEKTDDSITLEKKLVSVGIDLLFEVIDRIKNSPENIYTSEQKGTPSYAPVLKKSDGKINWNSSSEEIYNLIRGTKPWPSAYVETQNEKLKIKNLKILKAISVDLQLNNEYIPGTIVELKKNAGFIVKCGNGFLLIEEVQPEGKKPMSAWAWLQGSKLKVGDKL
ncbi:MAG: methionyl-tRNA formyltransferase [Endomicrobiia bacterium]